MLSEAELEVTGGQAVLAPGAWPCKGLVAALILLLGIGGAGVLAQSPANQGPLAGAFALIALPFAAFVAHYVWRARSGSPSLVAGPKGVRVHGLGWSPRLLAWSEVEAIEVQRGGNVFFSRPATLIVRTPATSSATFVPDEGLEELLQQLEALRLTG